MCGSSAGWLLAGDAPAMPPGEFQLLAVAGEVAGESSLFMLRLALARGAGGAAMGSRPAGCFLRCERCLSSMFTRPSLVNGFGRTSFMPGSSQLKLGIIIATSLN